MHEFALVVTSEHLSVLEQDLNDRNSLLKASQDEIKQLREENAERELIGTSRCLPWYTRLKRLSYPVHSPPTSRHVREWSTSLTCATWETTRNI